MLNRMVILTERFFNTRKSYPAAVVIVWSSNVAVFNFLANNECPERFCSLDCDEVF